MGLKKSKAVVNYQGHETFMPYVLNRTTGAVNADFQVVLRNHGMTLLHWRVLAFLRETDGLGISAWLTPPGSTRPPCRAH